MKQSQSVRKQAEDLLLGRPPPIPILVPRDPRNSNWLAQPYFGPVLETYTTDSMDSLGPPVNHKPQEDD